MIDVMLSVTEGLGKGMNLLKEIGLDDVISTIIGHLLWFANVVDLHLSRRVGLTLLGNSLNL